MISDINISPEFKTQVVKTIAAIVLFVLVYLIILVATLAFTIVCVGGGLGIIFAAPGILTIIIGVGLAGMGVIILFFVVKFIFKSHKIDRSHLIEIKAKDEPELFQLIKEIVEEVGTDFPQKVYLSSRVNAAVFYNSSFWSMFFPIRKNLEIGMGLVNSLTAQELKAVLAHEFGHFSQKTMKVGSYVYNVNSIIHNMLYDNDGIERGIQSWASWSWIVALFAQGAILVIKLVQKILQLVYGVVNKNYLALSREMEFHADEVAVNVSGIKSLCTALPMIQYGNDVFELVGKFYINRVTDNVGVNNLYPHHRIAMEYLAKKNSIPLERGLPVVDLTVMSQFSKSKLIIENQWASHPTDQQRIERMQATGVPEKPEDDRLANDLFADLEATQQQLTEIVFAGVAYEIGGVTYLNNQEFKSAFQLSHEAYDFDPIFNGYYDLRDIDVFNLATVPEPKTKLTAEELFSDERVEMIKSWLGLQQDIASVNAIAQGRIDVKTFDYNGQKYRKRDASVLASRLQSDYETTREKIKEYDQEVYVYLRDATITPEQRMKLDSLYEEMFNCVNGIEDQLGIYHEILEDLNFLQETTPHETIISNFVALDRKEAELKKQILDLRADPELEALISSDARAGLDKYLVKDWKYFGYDNYYEDNLQVLYGGLNGYAQLVANAGFLAKQQLLDHQAMLIRS